MATLGSVLQETIKQEAPGKCTSVLTLTSVTGNSSYRNISGAVYKKKDVYKHEWMLVSQTDLICKVSGVIVLNGTFNNLFFSHILVKVSDVGLNFQVCSHRILIYSRFDLDMFPLSIESYTIKWMINEKPYLL